tara:strand:- start:862 stop:2043 length:1182 start_codon:yes stop_codon:yes gene_type:complete
MINKAQNYKSQAHEFYYALQSQIKSGEFSSSYMYWGKVGMNSESVDFEKLNAVLEENRKLGKDTHLYITDYHQFWIAKVQSVHREINDYKRTLPFYDSKQVDVWFKITDFDLVSAEFEETSYYISNLYVDNVYQQEKVDSVHPYLGGLSFPLVVQDHLNQEHFRKEYMEDGLKIMRSNPLIENLNGARDLKTMFKSFVLPPQVFCKLSPHVRNELFLAEMELAKGYQSEDVLFKTLFSYLKILEGTLNDTIGEILKEQFGNCLYINEEGTQFSDQMGAGFVRLDHFSGLISLESLVSLPEQINHFGNLSLDATNSKYSELIEYFLSELIPMNNKFELAALRSQLKPEKPLRFSKSFVYQVRNQILGVGCKGVINNLVEYYLKADVNRVLARAS